jgi:plastocyanin
MRPHKGFLVALLAAGGLAAGCGAATQPAAPPASSTTAASDSAAPSDAMPGMTGMSAPQGGDTAPQGAPVATNAIAIKNFAFAPDNVTVKAGATITWTNSDQEPHTVTSKDNNGPLRSPTLNSGATYTYTFTAPGKYEYLCTIHPFMVATVVVTP